MKRLQGTKSDFDHDLFDDWLVSVHDSNTHFYTDAHPFRRLPVHGHFSIGRHAVLRPSAPLAHANQVPAGSHLLEKGVIHLFRSTSVNTLILRCRSIGSSPPRSPFHTDSTSLLHIFVGRQRDEINFDCFSSHGNSVVSSYDLTGYLQCHVTFSWWS